MAPQLGLGITLVFLGGILNGSFAAPMKRLSRWRWENTWLLWAIAGLVVFPWAFGFATVPHLASVLGQASGAVLGKVAFFGFAWGIGAVLFGQGIARVGLALGFSIILGISGSFGSLLPMAILHPEQLTTRPGIALIVGTVIMALGLIFLALAGQRRERERAPAAVGEQRPGFGLGLIICVLSGLFSSLLNFTFVFGAEITDISLRAGASQIMAGNGIWALGVSCGFLPNVAYCIYLLNKNHTWGVFREKGVGLGYTLGATFMGFLWFAGVMVYGMGADVAGTLGGIIGWPVYMSVDIITGVVWGFLGREWKGASRAALTYCLTGIAVLFIAIAVISFGNAS
jgi:L-rhamnose-H+ transport protein